MLTILSLFDYSGVWSQPYADAGYNVVRVDLKNGQDVMTFDYKSIGPVYGILAAPPCTCFSISGARWWAGMDASGRTAVMVTLLKKTIEIIDYLSPSFWAIENPVGRIADFAPEIGKPWYFQPCDYGDPYTKKTGLWGDFVPPLPIFLGSDWSVVPSQGSKMHLLPQTDVRSQLRSETPAGFARAFYLCNRESSPR